MSDLLEGRNPITEALKADREIDKILYSGVDGSVKKILGMAKDKGIPTVKADRKRLDELSETGNHQGVIAYVSAHRYYSVEEILEYARSKGEQPFIVVLDEIEDPHNLGSIMRSAEGAGVHGIIIPKRHSVGLNSTVAKTSAGAIEYMRVAKVSNIASTIEKLKKDGIWFYATHQDATMGYDEADYSGGVGIVIGSEGKGVSRIVAEKCDFLISIPMKGKINSLNASVAAGIIIYNVINKKD
ncbi:MAG: 23S rRNA (guanosine(2251)-2'-O)-methyltransferase RlmB [Clostridia bacterium]|nr:23S rRNA (guanosine(2251)-2'-O)-methyltransferase RlmB [Clostridia bacterium]